MAGEAVELQHIAFRSNGLDIPVVAAVPRDGAAGHPDARLSRACTVGGAGGFD
jgi:hypothetical protein